MKFTKTIIAFSFALLFLTNTSQAANLYRDEAPKDSDLDGLTDQGETQLFFTDPNNPDSDNDGFLDGTEILVETNPLEKNDPLETLSETNQNSETPWNWYLARTSGIAGYILLFILTMGGLGITTGYIFNFVGPIIIWRFHRATGILLVPVIFIHLLTLYRDNFINFSLSDLLIPFAADFKPLYMSMGIIGFYLLILIIITSIVLIVKKYKAWRLLHYLTIPAFILLFLHGVLIGTDTNTLAMQIVYWSTGSLVSLAFIYRIIKIPSLISNPNRELLKRISMQRSK